MAGPGLDDEIHYEFPKAGPDDWWGWPQPADFLSRARKAFEQGNPLGAWHAWDITRRSLEPIPAWVLDYLDSCARQLIANMPDDDPFPDPEQRIGPVGKRLGFNEMSLSTARRDISDPHVNTIAYRIVRLMLKLQIGFDAASRQVPGAGRTAAREAFDAADDRLDRLMAGIIYRETGEMHPKDRKLLRNELSAICMGRRRKGRASARP